MSDGGEGSSRRGGTDWGKGEGRGERTHEVRRRGANSWRETPVPVLYVRYYSVPTTHRCQTTSTPLPNCGPLAQTKLRPRSLKFGKFHKTAMNLILSSKPLCPVVRVFL